MISAMHAALQAFWGGFRYASAAVPAYEIGNVPDNAAMPYITYEVGAGAILSAGFLTAFVWVKRASGYDAQVVRATILDSIAAAIPEAGLRLDLANDAGMVTLERNGAGFLQYYDDPTDTSVLGGRVSVEAHYYPA